MFLPNTCVDRCIVGGEDLTRQGWSKREGMSKLSFNFKIEIETFLYSFSLPIRSCCLLVLIKEKKRLKRKGHSQKAFLKTLSYCFLTQRKKIIE